MNYELIIDELKTWQEDESLFRDYYFVNKGNYSLDSFLEKYESDPVNLNLALHPDTIPKYRPENDFISIGRNVAIVKHPRYIPLFFHEHAFFEIIYVLSGSCTQHFQESSIRLAKGDLCMMAPDVMHGIEVMNDSIVLNILIRYSTFIDIFMNTIRDKTQISQFFLDNIYSRKKLNYILFHTQGDTVIRNYILDMYLEQIYLDEFSDRIICSFLTIFFTQLMRRHKRTLELPRTHLKKDDLEDTITNYIIEHYHEVSIEQVAEHFHFSRQYCSKLVKDISGYTFSEFLTNIRIRQGENLLTHTTLSIADISEKVGYKNPETFIRAFKKSVRCTPTDFRKQISPFAKGQNHMKGETPYDLRPHT